MRNQRKTYGRCSLCELGERCKSAPPLLTHAVSLFCSYFYFRISLSQDSEFLVQRLYNKVEKYFLNPLIRFMTFCLFFEFITINYSG